MKTTVILAFSLLVAPFVVEAQDSNNPNILFLFCDDLNRSGLGSAHDPLVDSPHIDSLYQESVVFTNAHANATICGPSRASVFSGLLPTSSGNYGYRMAVNSWMDNPTLDEANSIFKHFKDNGYLVYGSGKIYHKNRNKVEEFDVLNETVGQGPFAFDRLPHSSLPIEFDEYGLTFSPIENVPSYPEFTGWKNTNGSTFTVIDSENRSLMADEQSVLFADSMFSSYADSDSSEPFFMTVGLYNPHEPFHVPQEYFDRYPLDSIDVEAFVTQVPSFKEAFIENRYNANGNRGGFEVITENAPEDDEYFWLKRYIQGYYASISFTDDRIGEILQSLEENGLSENTIVVLSSDHGLHLGEREILKKTSLWNGSTQVPLMFRIPGREPSVHFNPVSLVDIYPTLIDLAGLSEPESHSLDGLPIDDILDENFYDGTIASVSSNEFLPPNGTGTSAHQHHCILIGNYKYILYSSGEDEMYRLSLDPNELNDLSEDPSYDATRSYMHNQLSLKIDNLRQPSQNYNAIYYGDFDQDFNGWKRPTNQDDAIISEGDEFLPSRHLVISNGARLVNRSVSIKGGNFYTIRFEAYNEGGSGTLQFRMNSTVDGSNNNEIAENIEIGEEPQVYTIEFLAEQDLFRERVVFEPLTSDPMHFDNIEIIQDGAFAEALVECAEPKELISNQPFNQLGTDSLFIMPDQPDFQVANTPQLSKQKWYSFTPNSSLGLIGTRIIGSGNAVIEVWDGCGEDVAISTSNVRSGRIESLVVDSLNIGETYSVRIGDAKTDLDLESRTRTTYVDLYQAVVESESNGQFQISDIDYALFSPNQVRFKFTPLDPSLEEVIAFRLYDSDNSYNLNGVNLEDGDYMVSVAYRLVPLSILVPYGDPFLYSTNTNEFSSENASSAYAVFPNPLQMGYSNVNIQPVVASQASTVDITLIDMQGRVVSQHRGLTANATNQLEIPIDLSKGVYIIQVVEDSGEMHILKLQI